MKLAEALPVLEKACNVPFGKLFQGHPDDLRTNKGNAGQLLCCYIGLKLNSDLCDFDDGELKTNKALPDGTPRETMFITQINAIFDTLVAQPNTSFLDSSLYIKIRNLVYLPVVKQSENASDWYFPRCIHIEAKAGGTLFDKLRDDYDTICNGLRHHVETSNDGFIHTTSGSHYIQVRSKDSKPYHPIYSSTYQREVSIKNHAFYFLKSFMQDALAGRI